LEQFAQANHTLAHTLSEKTSVEGDPEESRDGRLLTDIMNRANKVTAIFQKRAHQDYMPDSYEISSAWNHDKQHFHEKLHDHILSLIDKAMDGKISPAEVEDFNDAGFAYQYDIDSGRTYFNMLTREGGSINKLTTELKKERYQLKSHTALKQMSKPQLKKELSRMETTLHLLLSSQPKLISRVREIFHQEDTSTFMGSELMMYHDLSEQIPLLLFHRESIKEMIGLKPEELQDFDLDNNHTYGQFTPFYDAVAYEEDNETVDAFLNCIPDEGLLYSEEDEDIDANEDMKRRSEAIKDIIKKLKDPEVEDKEKERLTPYLKDMLDHTTFKIREESEQEAKEIFRLQDEVHKLIENISKKPLDDITKDDMVVLTNYAYHMNPELVYNIVENWRGDLTALSKLDSNSPEALEYKQTLDEGRKFFEKIEKK